VKLHARLPSGMLDVPRGRRCASFDGDADRIVYYFIDEVDGRFHLLDGDAIAVLLAMFVDEQLKALTSHMDVVSFILLIFSFLFCIFQQTMYIQNAKRMGIVQTAYANGASTKFMTEKLASFCNCINFYFTISNVRA